MVSTLTPALGETVTVFVRVPAGAPARRVHVRYTPDGEPHFAPAVVDRTTPDATWWRAEVLVRNPVTNYRFLVDDRWLNGLGVTGHDVPDDLDFRLVAYDPPPARYTPAGGGSSATSPPTTPATRTRGSPPPCPMWTRPSGRCTTSTHPATTSRGWG